MKSLYITYFHQDRYNPNEIFTEGIHLDAKEMYYSREYDREIKEVAEEGFQDFSFNLSLNEENSKEFEDFCLTLSNYFSTTYEEFTEEEILELLPFVFHICVDYDNQHFEGMVPFAITNFVDKVLEFFDKIIPVELSICAMFDDYRDINAELIREFSKYNGEFIDDDEGFIDFEDDFADEDDGAENDDELGGIVYESKDEI